MSHLNHPPLRVAFAGAGAMAREHAKAFRAVPGVVLTGIWNRTRARAEALAAEHGIPMVCDSISELQARTQADLVVVAVLEPVAKATARQCFDFPWAVLMEKPPGLNLAEARQIQAAADARQRQVYVALNRRFYSSTQEAARDLATRNSRRFIHVQDQQDLSALARNEYPPELLANWMYANSIHLVDYLRHFGRGPVTRVRVIQPWDPANPDVVVAAVDFATGDAGLYTALWDGPGPWMVTVSTTARRWELRPLEQAQYQNRGERRLQGVELSESDKVFKPGLRLQAEQVVCALRHEPSSIPTLADALQTMELISQIYGHA